MTRPWILTLLIPWLAAAIPSTPPSPVEVTEEEAAELVARKVVVRMDTTAENGGGATGIVDVAADGDATWGALMDLKARVGEVGGLKTVEYYLQEPRKLAARWELKVLTVTVVFHNLYEMDRDAGWVRYALDPTRTNDLVSVQGAYQIYANEAGGTRIVYRSETDSGRKVPMWIKRWLATDSLTEQLLGIRARAEAAR